MVAGPHDAIRTLAAGRLSRLDDLDRLRSTDALVADIAAADASARVATIGLAELPDEAFATLPVLYVRGRLRRIASAMYLIAPSPDGMAEHLRLRDEAVADFRRGDLTAEVALTRGPSAAIHAISTWEDILEDLAVFRDARAQLDDAEESMRLPVLDQLQALVALAAGDLDAAITAVEQRRHLHPVFAAQADVGRAEHDLVTSRCSDDAVTAVLATLDRMRAQHRHGHRGDGERPDPRRQDRQAVHRGRGRGEARPGRGGRAGVAGWRWSISRSS